MKFADDSVSSLEFLRNLNLTVENQGGSTCCSNCYHFNGECIDFAKKGECKKYNEYHSFMLPAFPIGIINLKRKFLNLDNAEKYNFFIVEKLNDDEFGISFIWECYDDELGEEIVKTECNQDRFVLSDYRKSKKKFDDYFNEYLEGSTNYLYTDSFTDETNAIISGFKAHLDFWCDSSSLLEENKNLYIFKYEDFSKVLLSPNYNLKYAIFCL